MKNIIEIKDFLDPIWNLDYTCLISRAIEEEAYIIFWDKKQLLTLRTQLSRYKHPRNMKEKIHQAKLKEYTYFTIALKNGSHAACVCKKDVKKPFADLLQLYDPKRKSLEDYVNAFTKDGYIIVNSKMNGLRIMHAYKAINGIKGKGGYYKMEEYKDGRYIFNITK